MKSNSGMRTHIILIHFISLILVSTVTIAGFSENVQGNFNVTDETYFEIKWPGQASTKETMENVNKEPQSVEEESSDSMLIHAGDQSSYRCYLPSRVHNQKFRKLASDYTGPGPAALLNPLFEQKACSYKIESYWTYELCHGKHLRQYHEEMEGDTTQKKMEFYLGYYDHSPAAAKSTLEMEQKPESAESKATETEITPKATPGDEKEIKKSTSPPTINIEGTDFPYFQVDFNGGSTCDLTKQPRQVTLMYICLESGRGEIYDLTEVESCKYRVVVMSKLLCQHPAFQVARPHVNTISCRPADAKTPPKPKALVAEELRQQQQMERSHTSTLEGLFGRDVKIEATREKDRVLIRIASKKKSTEEGGEEATEGVKPTDAAEEPSQAPSPTAEPPKQPQHHQLPSSHPPALLLRSFVKGTDCLVGGAGWWRHEFCYGKSVIQYHDDAQTGKRTTIILGRWNVEKHRKWLSENPHGQPMKGRQFSLYFTEGDRCDETKRQRAVEVRVRCLIDTTSSSSTAMAIMLQEPSLCQYILTVESAMLCPLVNQVDKFGLLPAGLKLD